MIRSFLKKRDYIDGGLLLRMTVRDYEKLAARAERILARETEKSLNKRDESLISECVETLLFCNKEIAELRAKEEPAPQRRRGFAQPMIAAAASLLLIIGIASAFILSAKEKEKLRVQNCSTVVTQDGDGVSVVFTIDDGGCVTNSPNTDNCSSSPEVGTTDGQFAGHETRTFSGFKEIEESLGGRKLLVGEAIGFGFVSAEMDTFEGDMHPTVVIHTEYEGTPVDISASLALDEACGDYRSEPQRYPYQFSSIYSKNVCGVGCIFATGSEKTLAAFTVGYDTYTLIADGTADTVESIIVRMLQNTDSE